MAGAMPRQKKEASQGTYREGLFVLGGSFQRSGGHRCQTLARWNLSNLMRAELPRRSQAHTGIESSIVLLAPDWTGDGGAAYPRGMPQRRFYRPGSRFEPIPGGYKNVIDANGLCSPEPLAWPMFEPRWRTSKPARRASSVGWRLSFVPPGEARAVIALCGRHPSSQGSHPAARLSPDLRAVARKGGGHYYRSSRPPPPTRSMFARVVRGDEYYLMNWRRVNSTRARPHTPRSAAPRPR